MSFKNVWNAEIAEQKLDHIDNIQLKYGDAREIIPAVTDGTSPVIIDGPKGDEALCLALELLSNDLAPLVFVHDLHSGTFHRDISEMLFPASFFSDDAEFVERFHELDTPCWEALGDDMKPYVRHGEHIDSYGFTLGVFAGGQLASERLGENYYDYVDEQSASLAETLVETPIGDFYRTVRGYFRYIN